jgi:uncharacterized protein YecT (DUF1311 family)
MFPPASRLATSTAAFAVIGAFALALALVSCRPSAPDKSSSAASTQPPSASVQSAAPATPAPPAGNNASSEAATKDPCSEAETQADLTACWTRAAAEARSRATMTYARANDWLAQRGQTGAQQRLKQAQSSWDRYRSTYCEAVAAVYEGGSVAGTQKAHCEATLDTQYADQLTTLMNDASGP